MAGPLDQGGLGMPDRDYYLKEDAKFADTRTKYRAYVEQLLTLGGICWRPGENRGHES